MAYYEISTEFNSSCVGHCSHSIFIKKSCVEKNLQTKCYCNSYPTRRHYYKRVNQGLKDCVYI